MISTTVKFRSRSNESIAHTMHDTVGMKIPERSSLVSIKLEDEIIKGKVQDVEHEFDNYKNQITTIWLEEI